MPAPAKQLPAIQSAADCLSFLREHLGWPLPDDALVEELTFDWTGNDLRLPDSAAQKLNGGTVRQLRALTSGQPWGIFLVEFADPQVYRTALRQILRGLVPNRRHDPSLQTWRHENLLFICATADYERITFAHFCGEAAGRAKLTTFGWRRGTLYLRTLLEHNLPKLAWPRDDGADSEAWLNNWSAAFDKEAVTNKFFADFSTVFECLCNELQNHHSKWPKEIIEREAQTLLNRLLFLYFIQRKGWLNRQRDYFIRNLRSHAAGDPKGGSFYQKFLLPLFRMLSTEWKRRDVAVSGAESDDPRTHDLPFLNGGLFSDEFGAEHLDPAVRRHHELRVSNATLARIFNELLEAYNFTVREDTPLDVDVAIDPEMLGKIFESLVLQLEISGSGGKSSRHNTGSYYTPRPIVHYLCRDALAAWLADQPLFAKIENRQAKIQNLLALDASSGLNETARKQLDGLLTPEQADLLASELDELRACDPAVGSGAFPVVLLHELVNLLRLCETRARGKDPVATDSEWLFITKTRLIERILYGVDIQPRAIEICKLRLWLSLVVDYPLDVDVDSCERRRFQSALKKLPALPNLDFKIRAANSLADHIHGQRFLLKNLAAEVSARLPLNKLVTAKRDYFTASSVSEKRGLRFKIYEALTELGELELTRARNEYGLMPSDADAERTVELESARKELASVRVRLQAARKLSAVQQDEALEDIRAFFDDEKKPTFVWQLDFAEVFHRERNPRFDLIIGNPPFVRIQVLNQENPEFVSWLKENYHAASKGNYDLYAVFVERSLQLLQACGQLAFILPHRFFNAQYGQPLRELISRTVEDKKAAAKIRRSFLRHVVHFGDQQVFPGATNYVCLLFLAAAGAEECRWMRADDLSRWLTDQQAPEANFPASKITDVEWNFAVGKGAEWFERMKASPQKLSDVADLFVGLQTDADDVFIVEVVSEKADKLVAYSKFTQREHEFEADHLKQFLKGSLNIRRYVLTDLTKRLIFPYQMHDGVSKLISASEYERGFPLTWAYLKVCKKRLSERSHGEFNDFWHGYVYKKNHTRFEQPKLLVPAIGTEACFAADFDGCFYFVGSGGGGGGGYGITLKTGISFDLRFLLGVLNARVSTYFIRHTSTGFQGGYLALTKQFIEQLPIPALNLTQSADQTRHDTIVRLVEWILWLHRQPSIRETTSAYPRDPLIAAYFEQWVNALVYELFFAEELHAANLKFFDQFRELNPPALAALPDDTEKRLEHFRQLLDQFSASGHSLRVALDKLQTLDFVRVIEESK